MIFSADLWILHFILIGGGILAVIGLVFILLTKIPGIGAHFDTDDIAKARAKADNPTLHMLMAPFRFALGLASLIVLVLFVYDFFTTSIKAVDVKIDRGNLKSDEVQIYRDDSMLGLPKLLGGLIYEDFGGDTSFLVDTEKDNQGLVINSTGSTLYVTRHIYGRTLRDIKESVLDPLQMERFDNANRFMVGCKSKLPDAITVFNDKQNGYVIRVTERPHAECPGDGNVIQETSINSETPSLVDETIPATPNSDEIFDKGLKAFNSGDYQTALNNFFVVAEQGNAKAQFFMGLMHNDGLGLPQNLEQAANWYFRAAQQGHINAQMHLGIMFFGGVGVPKDHNQAFNWFGQAATQGDAEGQNAVGFMFERGFGVAKNSPEAVRWYRLAADQGLADAQYNLGTMYEKGMGVIRNITEATRLFRLAADQGDPEALEWFRKNK